MTNIPRILQTNPKNKFGWEIPSSGFGAFSLQCASPPLHARGAQFLRAWGDGPIRP
ncbi:hypothetical protein CCACVL1_08355 [Corchorus capsularis]|uniref:Uncharacterized protein n=1 Tax=Corchorus capsularis TaxID=210143 RepID=A0A1R3J0X4_COCAP|nr:hypothetical protein CCACVL1_08355 [Corchorus capsularis]